MSEILYKSKLSYERIVEEYYYEWLSSNSDIITEHLFNKNVKQIDNIELQNNTPIRKIDGMKPIIPQFYFPHGKSAGRRSEKQDMEMINRIFSNGDSKGLTVEQFEPLATYICKVSSFCSITLFLRIAKNRNRTHVSKKEFEEFFLNRIQRFDYKTRLFNILKADDNRNYLIRDDFKMLITEVVQRHRGLEFLDATPEFQFRYVQTVIGRIFYHNSPLGRERITLANFRKGNFPDILMKLDTETDLNKINDYFSYEHFYVIYCKFWELDTDHDFFIDIKDLSRYDNFSLTNTILDRIMSGIPVPLSQKPNNKNDGHGKMSYEDFITFFISEVDKTQPTSIDYWFNCIDLDGDGIISVYEMEPFLQEQRQRIHAVAQEPIQMKDLMCQISDMIKPDVEGIFRRTDLKRSKMTSNFFNILFNMNRYAIAESKDPYLTQQIHDTPDLSDWDRYALAEYFRLAEADDPDLMDQQYMDDHLDFGDDDVEMTLLANDDPQMGYDIYDVADNNNRNDDNDDDDDDDDDAFNSNTVRFDDNITNNHSDLSDEDDGDL